MPDEGEFDDNLRARLRAQMSRGEIVLFTGAGFSRGAQTPSGAPIASVQELKERLWDVAFGGQELDPRSTLGDIFEAAVSTARGKTERVLIDALRVDAATLPDLYRLWFAMPWYRHYTLNMDDLDDVVPVRFELPRPLKAISALTGTLPGTEEELWSIHLNGQLKDYPDVTFSQRQYGERTARPDPWYAHLVGDMAGRPVLFVGTELDEPSLWQHIELRRTRAGGRELRPGSLLVTPSLPVARRAILERFNVRWIAMTAEQFGAEVLAGFTEEAQKGLRALVRRREERQGGSALIRVADARAEEPKGDLAEFLWGREPEWQDFTHGFAVTRGFEQGLAEEFRESGSRVLLVTGTAGSGKSTTLRRIALELQAEGFDVSQLNLDREAALRVFRDEVRASEVDLLLIDDLDELNQYAVSFARSLLADNPGLRLLLGVRGTRYEQLKLGNAFEDVGQLQFTVPHLDDSDIDLLLDALSRANRLGQLRGMPREEQVKALRDHAGRQLLVAMIEATSGEKFEEKIERECAELPLDISLIYAMVSIATSFRHFLLRDEILLASGDPSNEQLNRLEALIRQRLLVVGQGRIRVRHRVIADHALTYYRMHGQLGEALQGLLFAMATKVRPETPWRAREKQLTIRLLNHDLLLRLTDSVGAVRTAYDEVEGVINWDYHYWLQRGALEVKVGDLNRAQNFLEQARSMAPTDAIVQTEWAYMVLKKATQEAAAPDAQERAKIAIEALQDSIDVRGRVDPYPFHVLGSQGLSWSRRAVMGRDERTLFLSRLREAVGEGTHLHPDNRELEALYKDVEREYLMMAVQDKKTHDGDSRAE